MSTCNIRRVAPETKWVGNEYRKQLGDREVEYQKTKMDMMYDYLIGSGFRNRIEALVEKLSGMMEDLLKERKAIKKVWSKREKDIRISIDSAAGMYGDLQGILGKALCEIASLDIVTAFEIEDESGRFSPEE